MWKLIAIDMDADGRPCGKRSRADPKTDCSSTSSEDEINEDSSKIVTRSAKSRRISKVKPSGWKLFRKIRAAKLEKRKSNEGKQHRCDDCLQLEDEIDKFSFDNSDALCEEIAVSASIDDDLVEVKCYDIDDFAVHDKYDHMCRLECGLLENRKKLFVTGNLVFKNGERENLVVRNLGPILEWWLHDYTTTDIPLIGVSTVLGYYYLKTPCIPYKKYFQPLQLKTYATSIVVRSLTEDEFLSYRDLVEKIKDMVHPPGFDVSEVTLHEHSDFVVQQIANYDRSAGENDPLLRGLECVEHLKSISGKVFSAAKLDGTNSASCDSLTEEMSESEEINCSKKYVDEPVKTGICQQIHSTGFQVPEIQSPEIQSPEIQRSRFQVLEPQSPEIQRFRFQDNEIQSPEIQSPEIQRSRFQVVEIQSPEPQSPEIQRFRFQDNEIQSPEIQRSRFQVPEIQSPEPQSPEIQRSRYQVPEIQSPEIRTHRFQFPEIQNRETQRTEVQSHEIQEFQIPQIHSPEIQSRSAHSPRFQIYSPEIQSRETQSPGLESLGFQTPKIQSPRFQDVETQSPGFETLRFQSRRFQDIETQSPLLETLAFQTPKLQRLQMQFTKTQSCESQTTQIQDTQIQYNQIESTQTQSTQIQTPKPRGTRTQGTQTENLESQGTQTQHEYLENPRVEDTETKYPEIETNPQKSVTTALVKRIFDVIFNDFIHNVNEDNVEQNEDNFNSSEEYDEIENEEFSRFNEYSRTKKSMTCRQNLPRSNFDQLVICSDLIKLVGEYWFYEEFIIRHERYKIGDCVLIMQDENPSDPCELVKIVTIFEIADSHGFHAVFFSPGSDTILGKAANENEYFMLNQCSNFSFSSVVTKSDIVYRPPLSNWKDIGGEDLEEQMINSEGRRFFYSKFYDFETCRFEDPPERFINPGEWSTECPNCAILRKREKEQVIELFKSIPEQSIKLSRFTYLKWKGEEYRADDCVFLLPYSFEFNVKVAPKVSSEGRESRKEVDEKRFPELYRKARDKGKQEPCKPYQVGIIKKIFANKFIQGTVTADNVFVEIRKFYRPEDTHVGHAATYETDLNLLYWSDEVTTIPWSKVHSKCRVFHCDQSLANALYKQQHFYFNQSYDATTQDFQPPTNVPKLLHQIPHFEPDTKKPLRTLDAFSGCGGLSLGLHQSGVSETCWAVDFDESAAKTFLQNNQECYAFPYDCSLFLQQAMFGGKDKDLPKKGDVEMLCGGPPCQGFSFMNRFRDRDCAKLKNSSITTFLGLCDWFRPRFFLFENVQQFIKTKKHLTFQSTLRCLLTIGYQCAFAVLEAGNYSLPQNRNRIFIIAAAPGETLPQFPDAIHSFNHPPKQLGFNLGPEVSKYYHRIKMVPKYNWSKYAPFRRITVGEAILDLHNICPRTKDENRLYDVNVKTHYQKLMRETDSSNFVTDHILPKVDEITQERINHIPKQPGADWRDLPNIKLTLPSGKVIKKLQYEHHDKKNGCSKNGDHRGVCPCVTRGEKYSTCDLYRQQNTLIPWCLVHTANTNNNWIGAFGRLDEDDVFPTILTKAAYIGSKTRIIHPYCNRCLSVRESARAQGFPDNFLFRGTITDRYRQIGNAVPPPLAKAIGNEIKKCL